MNKPERRLAAIVAIDVAGYSRLMHADEVGTLERLRQLRSITDPMSREHGGRIVGTAGDGLLLEFPSVVEAVSCALRVQQSVSEFNANTTEDQKMLFRIGINLGDVMVDGDDLLGDGVNVAARLEGLAEPGGICISRAARDQVRDKIDLDLEDMGEVKVKNIARPIRAFRASASPEFVATIKPSVSDAPSHKGSSSRNRTKAVAVAAAIVLAVVLAGGGFWWWMYANEAKLPTNFDVSAKLFELPTGPKLIVLPFQNLSEDPEQDYFVNGLTDDLISRLTQFSYLFVIARSTSMKYKNKSVNVKSLVDDLSVKYILQGSVRKSEENIRVNVQLIDAENGTNIWANTYDQQLEAKNIFDIQDEISLEVESNIAGHGWGGAIYQKEIEKVVKKRPNDLAAFQCILLAKHYFDTLDLKTHSNARECLESLLGTYPNHSEAWSILSWLYYAEYVYFANPLENPLDRALKAGERAVEIDPSNAEAFRAIAWTQFFLRNRDESSIAAETALKIDPKQALNLAVLSGLYIRLGEWELGKKLIDKAIKLSPNPPSWYYDNTAFYFYYNEKFEKALRDFLKTRNMGFHWGPGLEAIAYAELGRMGEAQKSIAEAVEFKPDFAETAKAEIEFWWWTQPNMVRRLTNALAKAGLQMPDS